VHEARPEHAIGFELVVRPASQSQILDRRSAAASHWLDVIELEESPGVAASAVVGDERAAAPIARPDFSLDVSWDRAAVGGCARLARSAGGRETALLRSCHHALQPGREGTLQVIRIETVTEEILDVPQQLMCGLAHRELNSVALRRAQRDPGLRGSS